MKKWMMMVLICLVLLGCQRVPGKEDISGSVVQSITITCQSCQEDIRRFYNTDEKMKKVLYYIRRLPPLFQTQDNPEQMAGRTICIQVMCSDGSVRIYRQKADTYFQTGRQAWKQMQPGRGIGLWQILMTTPSDPRHEHLTVPPLPHLPSHRVYFPYPKTSQK